jgi:hypothetical protein
MTSIRTTARLLAAAAALALYAQSAVASQPEKDADIFGTWTLTKILDSADVASINDKQAAKLIGKTMVVRRDAVLFNGEPCRAPDLTRHHEPAAKYVREGYHARVGHLGLPENITVIDLDCTEAFVKGKGEIVVFWEGYFFDAVKQPATKRAR